MIQCDREQNDDWAKQGNWQQPNRGKYEDYDYGNPDKDGPNSEVGPQNYQRAEERIFDEVFERLTPRDRSEGWDSEAYKERGWEHTRQWRSSRREKERGGNKYRSDNRWHHPTNRDRLDRDQQAPDLEPQETYQTERERVNREQYQRDMERLQSERNPSKST